MFIFSAIYLTVTMMLSAVSLSLSILVLNVHHSNHGQAVPQWVEVTILTLMAGVFCIETGTRWRSKRVPKRPTKTTNNQCASKSRTKLPPDVHAAVYVDNTTEMDKMDTSTAINDQAYTCCETEPGEREFLCESEVSVKSKESTHAPAWRDVSRVLDRLFFFLVLMAMLIASGLTLCAPYYATS